MESGTLDRYCRRKKIITLLPNSSGTISGSRVSTQPIFENITNCGIISVGNGIISPVSRPRKIAFLNGSRIFASANAASDEVIDPTIVTVPATMMLFLKPDRIGASVHIRTNVSHCGDSGIQTGGSANTSALVLSAVVAIHSSGAIITTAPRASTTNRIVLTTRFWAVMPIGVLRLMEAQ